ncbi:MAG: 2-hydroxychromene-2-carboxylate isomerase [Gammaproteobacteria bacterium]|nr:2-hydroxychromene-2-carboxylate isomerase [Gammaproteobacteria bacterium]
MSTTIEFHYDFGSPNAYLVHKVITGIAATEGIDFEYVPILLGGVFKATGNVSPAVALQGIRNKGEYQRSRHAAFAQTTASNHQVPNPHFPVNTLKIMRGATFARDKDYYADYIDAMYRAMWEEARKMDEDDLIAEALARARLPADEIIKGMSDPSVKQALIDATESSVARGTFGSPTFFVGNEIFFGKDKLRDALEWAQSRFQSH